MLGFFVGLAFCTAQAGDRITFGEPVALEGTVRAVEIKRRSVQRRNESRRESYVRVVFDFPPREGVSQYVLEYPISSDPITGHAYNPDQHLRRWIKGDKHTIFQSVKHPRALRLDDPRPLIPFFITLAVISLAGVVWTILMLVRLRQFHSG